MAINVHNDTEHLAELLAGLPADVHYLVVGSGPEKIALREQALGRRQRGGRGRSSILNSSTGSRS